MEISSADKLESAFKAAIKAGSAAISVTQNPLMPSIQKQTVELAAKSRLPAIYPRSDYVAYGGLISYGSDQTEPYQRAAVYVDKILKGAKPADLPVEQPDEVRVRDQSQDGEADRPDDSAECAVRGRIKSSGELWILDCRF